VLTLLRTCSRRAAVALAVATPLVATAGLLYAHAQSQQLSSRTDDRVLVGTLMAGGVLTVLVVLAGEAPVTAHRRLLRRTALGLFPLAVGGFVGMGSWRVQGCPTLYWDEKGPVLLLCAVVLGGATVLPWVVKGAPGRWSRWLIGPVAGSYLFVSAYGVYVVRMIVTHDVGGCGT